MPGSAAQRVIAYIDGFNLYFGLKAKGWRKYYWLDLPKLVSRLMLPGQQLLAVKYCTARVAGPSPGEPRHRAQRIEDSRRRQKTWLEALETLPLVSIFEGHYLSKELTCFNCGNSWTTHEEKMTDVQIATQLLVDAFTDQFDSALVISADSDLAPPIQEIRNRFQQKRIVAAFPPARTSQRLRQIAHASFVIGEAKLRQSQLPSAITKADGNILHRPAHWH
jgi:uncharacterized LabA/DUF88 family protein